MHGENWNGTGESTIAAWCRVREGVNTLSVPAGKMLDCRDVSAAVLLPDGNNNAGLLSDPFMLAEWNHLDEIVQWFSVPRWQGKTRLPYAVYGDGNRAGPTGYDFRDAGWRESMDMVNSFTRVAYEPQDLYVPHPRLQFLPDIKQTGSIPDEPDLSGWQDARVMVNTLSAGWHEKREPGRMLPTLPYPFDKGSADTLRSAELNG